MEDLKPWTRIDYYGVTFDHLVPSDDTDPEVLQINIIEMDHDEGACARQPTLTPVPVLPNGRRWEQEDTVQQSAISVSRACLSSTEESDPESGSIPERGEIKMIFLSTLFYDWMILPPNIKWFEDSHRSHASHHDVVML
ncbi:hypothetical protein CEP54_008501 [Fusarium duplospermum]|uniref:Uncharacterized protein n=1 Tax=Fusarium duplospermum TaxID=1325734 RepID=A0A428PVP7_9HYPO|nr:hypothetical protein CEP54_008501 [Fusarium duplospermum]